MRQVLLHGGFAIALADWIRNEALGMPFDILYAHEFY